MSDTEQPATPENAAPKEGHPRRELLRQAAWTTVFLASGAVCTYIERLVKKEPEDPRLKELRDTYVETGRIEDTELFRQAYVAYERNMLKQSGETVRPDAECQQEVRQFLDGIQGRFVRQGAIGNVDRTLPSMQLLLRLQQSFEGQCPQHVTYNRSADSVLSVPQGRLQCRSGTRMFILATHRTLARALQDGEELVEIYTTGHVRPGLITADGQIFGLEMTQRGGGAEYVGQRTAPPPDVRIVRADDALAQEVLHLPQQHQPRALIDTVSPQAQAQGDRSRYQGRFGFGPIAAPEGDQQIQTLSPAQVAERRRRAEQVQNLLRSIAPRLPATNQYLQFLPQMVALQNEMRAHLTGGVLDRLETLSDADLEQLHSRIAPVMRRARALYSQHRLHMTGLRIAAAAGVPGAEREIRELEEREGRPQEHGVLSLRLPDELERRRALIHGRRELDPIFEADLEIEDLYFRVRMYIAQHRRELIRRIVHQER